MECELIRYVVNKDIIPLYLDTAKTYMNLSSGGLALTVIFLEKVVGSRPGTRVSAVMLLSWISFLLAIGSSAFYQYLAVKFLDAVSCAPAPIQYFENLVKNPGGVYGAMVAFFFVGSSLLVLAGWRQLPWKRD